MNSLDPHTWHAYLLYLRIPLLDFCASQNVNQRRANHGAPQKERLGITAGEELPRRGRCQHYSKSVHFTYLIQTLWPADVSFAVSLVQVWMLLILGRRQVWTKEMLTKLSSPGSHVATKCFHVTGVSYSDALVILRQFAGGKS